LFFGTFQVILFDFCVCNQDFDTFLTFTHRIHKKYAQNFYAFS
jgi:hypothetical protein